MSLNRAPLEHDINATSASWYAPLAIFVAWLAQLFAQITKLKRIRRTTTFKPNWADHWDGLRNGEWRRDQLITQCTAHVLAGGSLDDDKAVDILPDPPAGYGGPCPRTPFEMNRRFLYLARFLADPAFFIRRRIARIAKRERIDLSSPRLAHGSTDAALCAAAHHELVGAAALCFPRFPFALILSSAQSARPSKDERGYKHARGPPQLSQIRNTHLAATCENAPACPARRFPLHRRRRTHELLIRHRRPCPPRHSRGHARGLERPVTQLWQ